MTIKISVSLPRPAPFLAAILAISSLMLVACTSQVTPPEAPPPPNGQWHINRTTCEITAYLPDFQLTTDGKLSENSTLRLKTTFTPSLLTTPLAEVSGLPVPVPVEGPGQSLIPFTGRHYGIILAYDAPNVAHMLEPDSYLIITYQPIGQVGARSSHVSTRELMHSLSQLGPNCPS